jgi:hypothetical protein
MAGVDLSTRECDGQFVVALHGQLDMAEAASVAAALAAVAARGPQIIVDLAYPFRPVASVGLEVDAPVSVVMAGVPEDP